MQSQLPEPNHPAASASKPAWPDPSPIPDDGCPCECVWTCVSGRTRLACQLRQQSDDQFHIDLLRNSRTYGTYQFDCRVPALTFASRLRETFAGNGWATSENS